MSLLGGILQGAGSLLGGIFGYAGQKSANDANLKATRETNEANRLLNERQYEMSKEFWNMQNEYNLPSSQMQRLKDAGLNPQLVYGNGSVVGNSSSAPSVPSVIPNQAFTGHKNELAPLGDAFGQMAYSISQLETLRSQQDLYRVNAEKSASEKVNQDIKNEILGNNAVAEGQMSQARLENIKADTSLKNWTTDLTTAKTNNEIINSNVLAKQLDKIEADIAYTLERKKLLPIEADKLRANVKQLEASAKSLNSLSDKTELESDVLANDLIYRDLNNLIDSYEKIYKVLFAGNSVYGRIFSDIAKLLGTATDRQAPITDALKEILEEKGYDFK